MRHRYSSGERDMTVPPVTRQFPYRLFYRNLMSRLLFTEKPTLVREEYPTAEQLLGNLPVVLRALCDHVLTGQSTPLDVAYRLASLIDAVENVAPDPTWPDAPPHCRH